jgi:hypothetical protein
MVITAGVSGDHQKDKWESSQGSLITTGINDDHPGINGDYRAQWASIQVSMGMITGLTRDHHRDQW